MKLGRKRKRNGKARKGKNTLESVQYSGTLVSGSMWRGFVHDSFVTLKNHTTVLRRHRARRSFLSSHVHFGWLLFSLSSVRLYRTTHRMNVMNPLFYTGSSSLTIVNRCECVFMYRLPFVYFVYTTSGLNMYSDSIHFT